MIETSATEANGTSAATPARAVPSLLVAPLLILAAAIRIAVDNVTTFSRADETVYLLYAKALAAGRGYPAVIRMFLGDRSLWVFPHPLRWSYLGAAALASSVSPGGDGGYRALATLSTISGIVAVALTYWIGRRLFGLPVALAATALAATSPLQLALGRRALSDEFFCALVLASMASLLLYLRAEGRGRVGWAAAWIGTATLTFAAKEQFLCIYPVVLLYWWLERRDSGRRGLVRDAVLWALPPGLYFAVFCLLARDVMSFFRIARITTSVMRAPYAEALQSGPPHRLILDSLAVAPLVTMFFIAAAVMMALRPDTFPRELRRLALLAAGIMAVHAMVVPSQNLRYIVSADPFVRLVVAAFLVTELRERPRILLTALLVNAVVELTLFHDIFIAGAVYDPVTQNLLQALRMVP